MLNSPPLPPKDQLLLHKNYIIRAVERMDGEPAQVSELAYDLLCAESVQLMRHIVKQKSRKDQSLAFRMLRDLNLSTENAVQIMSAVTIKSEYDQDSDGVDDDFDGEYQDPLKTPGASSHQLPGVAHAQNDTELVMQRLELIGFAVGRQVSERIGRERSRSAETLDAIKFVCKEFWLYVFKKQIDNLKTNHKGIFVLQDNQFKLLVGVSGMTAQTDVASRMAVHMAMPCGMIRGLLHSLGIEVAVSAEIVAVPQCTFKIEVVGAIAGK